MSPIRALTHALAIAASLFLLLPFARGADPQVIPPGVLRASLDRGIGQSPGMQASVRMQIPEFDTAWEIGAGQIGGKPLLKLEARKIGSSGVLFGAALEATPLSVRTPIEVGIRLPFREGMLDLSLEPWASHRDRRTGLTGSDHGIKILGTQAFGNLVEIEGALRASLLGLGDEGSAGAPFGRGRSFASSLQGRLRLGERWALQAQATYESRSYKLVRDADTRLTVGASVRLGKGQRAR